MTKYNPRKHHRRSVRLRGYDYSQPGAYFVTTNVRDGACVLGDVVDGQVRLTDIGRVAYDFWAQVPVRFPNVTIDERVVMPNHVHAIIIIHQDPVTAPPQPNDGRGGVIPPKGASTAPLRPGDGRGGVVPLKGASTAPLRPGDGRGGVIPPKGASTAPLRPVDSRGGVVPPTLGQIVAYFKYETTTQINDLCGNDPMPFWQRSFYDHIIRNRRALDAIRKYIADNPFNWELDQDHPNNAFSVRKGNRYGI